MKIDPTQELLKTQHTDKTSATQKPDKDEFSAMLKEAIESDSSSAVQNKKGPAMINSVAQLQFSTQFAVQSNPMVERTEQFLDLLEEYQNKLMDPQASLRDIHPLIEKMEKEKDALAPLMDSLPDEDELKDVLNNTLMTSTVEMIKYNRGDYV